MKRLRPWSKMGVLFFVGLVFAIGQFKIPPMLTEIMEDLGIGLACSGLLMTVVAITAIFLAFFGGLLTVRFHPKKLGIAAICFGFVGNAIGFFASNFWVLLASRLIEGLGYGIIGTIGPTLISYWFPEEKRNKPMALWTLWVPIGMLIAFNGANAVLLAVGWRGMWALCDILFVVALALFCVLLDESGPDCGIAEGRTLRHQKSAISLELKNPAVWALTLIFTVYGLGCSSSVTFGPTFCEQHLGMEATVANAQMSLKTVGMIAGGFAMTGIFAVFTRRGRKLMIPIAILTGVLFGISFQLTSPSQVIPFALIDGFVLQGIPVLVFAFAPEAARNPTTTGFVVGIANAGDHLGSFIGSISIGAIVESAGNVWGAATPWMVGFALLGVVGALSYNSIMRKREAKTFCG